MRRLSRLVLAVMAVPLTTMSLGFAAGTVWLPPPGGGSMTVSMVSQNATEYWRITKRPTPGGEELSQQTIWLDGTYGLSDAVAIDFRAGVASSSFPAGVGPATRSSYQGATDMNLGMTFRIVDELVRSGPSVALRVGAIKAGMYETGNINTIGDGGSGVEVSALVGRFIGDHFAFSGEFGYRYRNNNIPANTFSRVSAGVIIGRRLGVSFAYDMDNATSGLEIGGPGFSPARFPEVHEDIHIVGPAATLAISDSVSVGMAWGQVVKGRNTAASTIYSVFVGYTFD